MRPSAVTNPITNGLVAGPNRRVTARMVVAALMVMIVLGACGSDDSANGGSAGGSGEEAAGFAGLRREPPPQVNTVTLPLVGDSASASSFHFQADPGEILVVYFGYTHCPDVCPTTMADVVAARQRLGEDGDRIRLAMVTVDPDRDTEEVLGNYVRAFVPDGFALRSEDDADLQAAADLFGVFYEVGTNEAGAIEVQHTATLFGVDDEGKLVASWSFGTPVGDLTNDLGLLLKET